MPHQVDSCVRDDRSVHQVDFAVLVWKLNLLNYVAKLMYVCHERLDSEAKLRLDLRLVLLNFNRVHRGSVSIESSGLGAGSSSVSASSAALSGSTERLEKVFFISRSKSMSDF